MNEEMCYMSSWCSANDVWAEAQDAMKRVLIGKSFADLAQMNKKQLAEQARDAG
jgi:DNA-binding IscR family transcriptional regulator